MYGNAVKAGDSHHKVFDYGIPIPANLIKNETWMKRIRNNRLYNRDLPGNLEDVHPNKFLASITFFN